MVITRKFNHRVQNDLTIILGYIEVAKIRIEDNKLAEAITILNKSISTIQVLSHTLNNRIKEDHETEEKKK